jgi:hypothetical protein
MYNVGTKTQIVVYPPENEGDLEALLDLLASIVIRILDTEAKVVGSNRKARLEEDNDSQDYRDQRDYRYCRNIRSRKH